MAKFIIESAEIGKDGIRQEIVETTAEEDAFYAGVKALIAMLPNSEDVTILVLRAHLIIEQLVIRTTASLVANPEHLQKANRLPFSTRVIFLRSLMRPLLECDATFWESIERLNRIRNDLAHKLDLPALDKDIDAFVAAAAATLQPSVTRRFDKLSRMEKLRRCLEGLCKFTAGMLAVTWQDRFKRPAA